MKIIFSIFALIVTFGAVEIQAQTAVYEADKTDIINTALDYIDGWYTGDAECM